MYVIDNILEEEMVKLQARELKSSLAIAEAGLV